MSFSLRCARLALITGLVAVSAAYAQTPTPAPAPVSRPDRLFLNFIEDATIPNQQWWEGQGEFSNGEGINLWLARGVVAFQLVSNLEVGGRVAFGKSDASPGIPDGTGATDLDAWAKYYFGGSKTSFAVSLVATVPTGDDTAGLGYDAFSVGAFGSLRTTFDRWIITGKIGVRSNGDGQIFGSVELDGEASPSLGGGFLYLWTDQVSLVGEINYEDGRFDGLDSDTRVLGGLNWRVADQGLFRAAVTLGLTDGAPDFQLLAGYAYTF